MNYALDIPLCRASDPIESYQAADAARLTKESHKRLIIAILEQHGPQGVDGIAAFCRLTGHDVGKRVVELMEEGKIALTGRKVKSDRGVNQREWMACN